MEQFLRSVFDICSDPRGTPLCLFVPWFCPVNWPIIYAVCSLDSWIFFHLFFCPCEHPPCYVANEFCSFGKKLGVLCSMACVLHRQNLCRDSGAEGGNYGSLLSKWNPHCWIQACNAGSSSLLGLPLLCETTMPDGLGKGLLRPSILREPQLRYNFCITSLGLSLGIRQLEAGREIWRASSSQEESPLCRSWGEREPCFFGCSSPVPELGGAKEEAVLVQIPVSCLSYWIFHRFSWMDVSSSLLRPFSEVLSDWGFLHYFHQFQWGADQWNSSCQKSNYLPPHDFTIFLLRNVGGL